MSEEYFNKNIKNKSKIGQDQIHGLLFGNQLSWQAIIYDLINTEQLDPWDIDITLLANKYLERIREMEEANLFVSSKVLFAASLLLRIKSEILLNQYIPDLDSILFGKKEGKRYVQERIELDEEIPELVPRTPMPRFKKVTLQELMSALSKAVKTENRRIKRVITAKQHEIETAISLPKKRINIRDKIKEVYRKLVDVFSKREERISFSEFTNGEDKIATFVPLLHLDNQHKVFLEQEKHLEEIYIWMKEHHDRKFSEELERMKKEVETELSKESLEEN
ncbi:segregation/condensation protein A [Candidatus Pacearchaeota archaeon]|nr:segregation/condensation protein A [Candidatus Pacearchaeota archaeon]